VDAALSSLLFQPGQPERTPAGLTFDYLLKNNDGTLEGNETGWLIGERQTALAQSSLPGQ
jgi:hypothetical protein